MPGLRTASMWLKISLATCAVALVLFVIGFATMSWMTYTQYRYRDYKKYGLWQAYRCPPHQGCESFSTDRSGFSREFWFRACQVMECVGMVALIAAFILLVLYICAISCKRRNTLLATIIITFLSVFFIAVGVAVFATKFSNYGFEVSWSMGLAIAAAVFAFISGIMSVLEHVSK